MPTVTGYTAARMQQIEDETVVDGNIVGNDLVLVTREGTSINAGNVRGPQGVQGPVGEVSTTQMNTAIAAAVELVQATGAVSNVMLALNAVTETRIADSAVTANKLAAGAVTTAKIADNAVTAAKIADGSVGTAELADSAVTNAKISPGVISADKIADGQVTRIKIADNAINYWKQGFIFLTPSTPPGVDGGLWFIP